MGCAASKLENEDTVRRCKERRRLMKEAVQSRHHLAAAHSDYRRSLLLTGSALSTFAQGEPLSISPTTPAVLLHAPPHIPHAPPPQHYSTPSPQTHQTPPQFRHHAPPSHQTPAPEPTPPPLSPSLPSSKLPHILSSPSHLRRKKQPIKVPHILSDSSPAYTPKKPEKPEHFTYHARANSTFSNTPSQTESSVWNWENFYPPSPPDSEFFQEKESKRGPTRDELLDFDGGGSKGFASRVDNDDKVSSFSTHSRYTHKSGSEVKHEKSHFENPHWEGEGEETEREEVQCSEWGDHDHDHYSTTSASDVEGDDEEEEGDGDYDDLRSRSDLGTRSNFGSTNDSVLGGGVKPGNESSLGGKYQSKLEKLSDDGESSSMSWGYGKGNNELVEDRRIVVRHKDLVEIVAAIKEYFDKAAAAGDQVSEMLETGRAQLSQLKSKLSIIFHDSTLFI